MPQSDWTVAFDDRLRQYLRTCTLCSVPLHPRRSAYGTYNCGPWSVDTALCLSCARQPQAWEQVKAKLGRRYGAWGADGTVLSLRDDLNNGTSTEEQR